MYSDDNINLMGRFNDSIIEFSDIKEIKKLIIISKNELFIIDDNGTLFY